MMINKNETITLREALVLWSNKNRMPFKQEMVEAWLAEYDALREKASYTKADEVERMVAEYQRQLTKLLDREMALLATIDRMKQALLAIVTFWKYPGDETHKRIHLIAAAALNGTYPGKPSPLEPPYNVDLDAVFESIYLILKSPGDRSSICYTFPKLEMELAKWKEYQKSFGGEQAMKTFTTAEMIRIFTHYPNAVFWGFGTGHLIRKHPNNESILQAFKEGEWREYPMPSSGCGFYLVPETLSGKERL